MAFSVPWFCRAAVFSAWMAVATGLASAPDPAGQQAAGIVAGLQSAGGLRLLFNERTQRLEVRDEVGSLLEEVPPGTTSRTFDFAEMEYRLSYGKDEMGRLSVLVRPGPAMQKPISVDLLGRKAVLSPNASLLATVASDDQVFYEPSLCGEVYYIEEFGPGGTKLSRLATSRREVAVLAKPSNPVGSGPGTLQANQQDGKEMEKAGDAFKSAVFAVLGLPDKQPSGKAKVYRLRSANATEDAPSVAPSVSAEAGRPDSGN